MVFTFEHPHFVEYEAVKQLKLKFEQENLPYDIYIFGYTQEINIPRDGKDKIFVVTGDKEHRWLHNRGDVLVTFKQYASHTPMMRYVPLPLFASDFPDKSVKAISERPVDICFIGKINSASRRIMKWQLDGIKKYTSFVVETSKEKFDINDYADILYDSKIAICPPGISTETIRYTEACKSGCCIICPRHLPYWYYKNPYEFKLDDWTLLEELIERIMNSPTEELNLCGRLTRQYYEDYLSIDAIFNFMKLTIDRFEKLEQ